MHTDFCVKPHDDCWRTSAGGSSCSDGCIDSICICDGCNATTATVYRVVCIGAQAIAERTQITCQAFSRRDTVGWPRLAGSATTLLPDRSTQILLHSSPARHVHTRAASCAHVVLNLREYLSIILLTPPAPVHSSHTFVLYERVDD